MTAKPVIPRKHALQDVDEAVDHYLREADAQIALGFVDDLQLAYTSIANHPSSGSPRHSYELGIPDLRSVQLKRYPYLIFYVEQAEYIGVWRVLHCKRDIPARLATQISGKLIID